LAVQNEIEIEILQLILLSSRLGKLQGKEKERKYEKRKTKN